MITKNWSDDKIIAYLRGTDKECDQALQAILENAMGWKEMAIAILLKMGATEEEAEEVFSTALLIFSTNVQLKKFNGESKASTYFIGICKNQFLKICKKKRKSLPAELIPTEIELSNIETRIIAEETNQERRELMQYFIDKLGKKCQQVLGMLKMGKTLKEIAGNMGWQYQNAKNAAKECRDRFRNLILENEKAHKKFKELQ